jgi:AraC-like DNA-binding protein
MKGDPQRRPIDWEAIGECMPRARLAGTDALWGHLAALIGQSTTGEPSPESVDSLVRHAVEFGRDELRLERCAIFLLDAVRGRMLGTWGTGARGETVDEHALTYQSGDVDREVFRRAQAGIPWTVYEDCPHIAQIKGRTQILGRGWVACTPIRGPRGPLGILYNDTALTRTPVDDRLQALAAILCAVLGPALERAGRVAIGAREPRPAHPLVRRVTQLLAEDARLSGETLAQRLHMSADQVARTFKREAGTSLVEYRNEVRLARFLDRADVFGHNLVAAALDAGFGSYAQFHRVFRARFGRSPRDYLLDRAGSGARAPEK